MKRFLLYFFLALFFYVNVARAQELIVPPSTMNDQIQQKVITDIAGDKNVTIGGSQTYAINLTYEQLEGRKVAVSFDLVNSDSIQPDIKYALLIGKKNNDGNVSVVARKIVDEVLSMSSNQTISKKIEFDLPSFINGECYYGIQVTNSSGNLFSLVYGGIFQVAESNDYVKLESCYLKVVNENGDKIYTLEQGVSIEKNESLLVYCKAINKFGVNKELIPYFDLYNRTIFGEKNNVDIKNYEHVFLDANQEKEVYFEVPKNKKNTAGAYDVIFSLKNTDGVEVSNLKRIHYVIAGVSTAITNLKLDKDYYSAGDNAQIEITWTKPADNFYGSRLQASELVNYSIEVLFLDGNGKNCTNKISKNYSNNKQFRETISANIINECLDPNLEVVIKDSNGNILDQKKYQVQSVVDDLNKESSSGVQRDESKINKELFFVLLILFFVLLLILFWIFFRKKKKIPISIVLFLFVFLSFAYFEVVSASSWGMGFTTDSACDNRDDWVSVNANTNKDTYNPSESIMVTVSIGSNTCLNAINDIYLDLRNDNGEWKTSSHLQVTGWDDPDGYDSVSSVLWFNNPGVGNHNFSRQIVYTCGYDAGSYSYRQYAYACNIDNCPRILPYSVIQPNDFAPEIRDSYPANGGLICNSITRVGVLSRDPDGRTFLNSDFYNGSWSKIGDDDRNAGPSSEWFYTYDRNWNLGRNDWHASVSDGRFTTWTDRYFNVNRAPTGINQNSPYSGQRFDSSGGNYWVNFSLSASDPDNNVNHMAVYVRNINTGQQYIPACEVWSVSGTCGMSLPPGNYGWSACAWDTPCNAAFCNWSWRPFQVNQIPTVTAQAPGSGCGQVNLSAIAQHNFVPGEQAWIRFDYWGGKNGSITYPISSSFQSFPLTLSGISGNSTIYWSVTVWDSNGRSSSAGGQSVTPNCTPNPPYGFNQTINCSQATLYASGSDPDGGQLYMTFTTNNPWMSNQVNIWSGQQASTTFNLGFDRAFSWMVSARDPYGAQRDSGWMGTYLTDRSPQGKVSDVLTYKAVNYNPSSAPRFVIDDAATRLQPVTVNDHSYDPDGNNQNVQATFWLEVNNAGTGSWQNIATSGLIAPNNINAGTYYHNITYNNLYAGQHRYRAQDRDACGATSPVSSYYNFTIAPPAVKNITVNSGTAGCPACGNRNTSIVVDWDDVPYIQNAQSSGIGGGYYVEWSNDGGATYRAVTKSLPDATAGWTSDSRIVLVTDVLNLYNLSTSTVRNIRYRVASYSNGVYSDWLYSNIVTYNCPIPGGLTITPNPVDMRGDEDSQPITARIHCRDFNGGVVGVLGGDMISAAQANRVYPPDTNPVSFVWNQTDIDNLNFCSTGTKINTPPNPGNTIHAGSNTTVDPCEGKLGATLTNYGWPEIGALTGDTWISINPRATEEFNYSGEVISNPPPGFEKLDLPGVQ